MGQRRGWLWRSAKGDKNPLREEAQLVVVLGGDRVLRLRAKGQGPWAEGLPQLAERFDLDRMARALDRAPRTDFRRQLDAFRQLRKGMSYAEAKAWVGPADRDVGSGLHIMAYRLEDGTHVLLGFADFNNLLYVKHHRTGGQSDDLVE